MSHFTVIVQGRPEDLERLLTPFSERIKVETYKDRIADKPDSFERKEAAKALGIDDPASLALQQVIEGYHKAFDDGSGEELQLDDEGLFRYSTYNPRSKWDWYVIGGRWTGYFKPKPGASGELGESGTFDNKPTESYVDVIKVGDIDVEAMRAANAAEALAEYDEIAVILGECPAWTSWEEMRTQYPANAIDAARAAYYAQPAIIALQKYAEEKRYFMMEYDRYLGLTREACEADARAGAIVPFAFLTADGVWNEKGDMGWWGLVSNEKEPDDWRMAFNAWFESLSPDTTLTLVDCHI